MRFVDDGVKTIDEMGSFTKDKIPYIAGDNNTESYVWLEKVSSLLKCKNGIVCEIGSRLGGGIVTMMNGLKFDRNFYYINTPIFTSADAEGAGEMFKVTNLDMRNIPFNQNGEVDYEKDFFGQSSSLTVSGQLEAELAALGFSKVYTFGPTLMSENSNTSRHLAEFLMIEPEVAFSDLHNNINLATRLLKYACQYILDNYLDDLTFLSQRREKEEASLKQEDRSKYNLLKSISNIIESDFTTLTYTDAFNLLKNSKKNKKNKFLFPVNDWGMDFQSEHERFLVEKEFENPVVIIDYPKDIKAFYMRLNEDTKTVRAMDVLLPGIGEIIGGSQREERLEFLEKRMLEMKIPKKDLWWYLETRRFGSVPHSGFGLGFERLVQFVTGMTNIRDVIPFPRYPSHIEF